MNIDLFRKYVELVRMKRKATDDVAEIQEQLKPLEELVIAELAASGVQNVKVDVDGKHATVYASTTMDARLREGVDRRQVAEALRASEETSHLVGYNAATLSAWVRERLGELRLPLPPELDALIETRDRVHAHVNESASELSKSARARRAVTSNSSTTTNNDNDNEGS